MLDTTFIRLERLFPIPLIFVVTAAINERNVGRWVGVEVANDAILSAVIIGLGIPSLDLNLTQSRLVQKRDLGKVRKMLAGNFYELGQLASDILVLELDPVQDVIKFRRFGKYSFEILPGFSRTNNVHCAKGEKEGVGLNLKL